MSNSTPETFLIEDPRISRITDKIIIGVKDGPASSNVTPYKFNSNSSSATMWNINVPSENTLIDRHLVVRTNITVNCKFTPDNTVPTTVSTVPTAFPLNSILQSASLTVNNSKVSVQSAEILPILQKQFSQQYLSKNLQGTPNYVDKYFGRATDAHTNKHSSGSYWSNFANAEKDTDTVARGGCAGCSARLFGGVITDVNGLDVMHTSQTIAAGVAAEYTIQFNYQVDEPLWGVPTCELNENESNFIGVKRLEVILQYGELKNICNIHLTNTVAIPTLTFNAGLAKGPGTTSTTVIDDTSTLVCKYMSLHASQYAKLSKRNIVNFDEFVNYPSQKSRTHLDAFEISSNELSLGQIPDKIYITVKPQPSQKSPRFSNNLCFPITSLNIKFNGIAGLMSDRTMADLFVISRRNGSNQTWAEFSGIVKTSNGAAQSDVLSLGSIIVLDPVRDLGLSDMLSASSLGSFSCQVRANVGVMHGVALADMQDVQLDVLCNYAGVMIIENGVSQLLSGLLTKEAVLSTKAKGSSNIDYEDVEKMAGGSIMKQGKSVIGKIIKSERGRVAKGLDRNVDGVVDKGADYGATKAKDYAHNRLSKYM